MPTGIAVPICLIIAWGVVHALAGHPETAIGGAMFGLGLFLLGFNAPRGRR